MPQKPFDNDSLTQKQTTGDIGLTGNDQAAAFTNAGRDAAIDQSHHTTYNYFYWDDSQVLPIEVAVSPRLSQMRPQDMLMPPWSCSPLVERPSCLQIGDWVKLFTHFVQDDSPHLAIACRAAFRAVFKRRFEEIRPDRPPLHHPDLVRSLLAAYDNPALTVRFVDAAIAELQRSGERRPGDLSDLMAWRDRIAQQHNIPSTVAEVDPAIAPQGYLLVTLVESGAAVIVYPEVRVNEEPQPRPVGLSPVTCRVDQVTEYLTQWIRQAEAVLAESIEDNEIILELFLPCALMNADVVSQWMIQDKRGRRIPLVKHRIVVIRSGDRLQDQTVKRALQRKWQLLQTCVAAGNACDKFHLQETALTTGDLLVLLKDAPGLKLAAPLPPGDDRQDLLWDVIDAAVPIALWAPAADATMLADLKTQMQCLIQESCLTNFADLVQRWRVKLTQAETDAAHQIRILCDRPDRVPQLPDPTQDNDLLVAV